MANPAAGVIFDAKSVTFMAPPFLVETQWRGRCLSLEAAFGKDTSWTETVLYKFTDSNDGARSDGRSHLRRRRQPLRHAHIVVAADRSTATCFELKPARRKPTNMDIQRSLWLWQRDPDGWAPAASLALDEAGDLYGTTQAGGVGTGCNNGCGTCASRCHHRPSYTRAIIPAHCNALSSAEQSTAGPA